MRVFVTGATGFIGRALVARLLRDGHEVSAWVRSPAKAEGVLEAQVRRVPTRDEEALRSAVASADAVVHLAGAPVAGKRWTASYKQTLRRSRLQTTARIVDAIRASEGSRPRVLVSASAVGIYGDARREVDEDARAANDFLAQLCVDWEAAAAPARSLGVRVTHPRFGIVLGAEGGALAKMLPAFRAGTGGKLGDGRQGMSWVHIVDAVEAVMTALTDERFDDAFNVSAPSPVTNLAFTKALGRALGRPTALPVPAFALKALFGEGAAPLLTGPLALPGRLRERGFVFAFGDLDDALRDILSNDDVTIGPLSGAPPSHPYVDKRGATYELRAEVVVDAPLERVFPFFSQAANLGVLTPPHMAFGILRQDPDTMQTGTTIDYRIALGPIPMKWRTRIERFEDGRGFVDSQLKGPYRSWYHEHWFEADGDRTRMLDRVYYKPPLGILGRIAHALFIRGQLERIFGFRRQAVRFRFGCSAP